MLPQILPLFPNSINRFIDLFAGGCNVGINVKANKIICNDYMKQIIDLYKYFQQHTYKEILTYINNKINEYKLSMTNKEGYLQFRDYYNKYKNPIDLFICICFAFNYSIRFNSKNEYNIAFGKDRSCFNSAIQERLKAFVDKTKDIIFTNNDFRTLKVEKLHKNDFVYCDPPYLITDANYNENGGWGEKSENDLLNLLDKLNNNNIRFALSNVLESKGKSNDILKEWSKKYKVHNLNYTYGNCNYQTKDKSKNSTWEVLITNY